MTNHWRDIRKAKVERGAKIIHVDPRFTRTSAVADLHLRIRTGTDAAFFGGLINYVLENDLIHEEYVHHYTNAAFVVDKGYSFKDGMFNSFDADKAAYDPTTWKYETGGGSERTQQSPGGLGQKAGAATGLTVESSGPS